MTIRDKREIKIGREGEQEGERGGEREREGERDRETETETCSERVDVLEDVLYFISTGFCNLCTVNSARMANDGPVTTKQYITCNFKFYFKTCINWMTWVNLLAKMVIRAVAR